jgi:ABC-type polysaccharide/polyol phosphate transport system ATPase subunit
MLPSSRTKTSSSSASDEAAPVAVAATSEPDRPRYSRRWDTAPRRVSSLDGAATRSTVEVRNVSLRFLTYHDKQYSLKRAALDLLLQREDPRPTSEFWALRDLNLSIGKGERVGIIGPNGAGKSTLLRVLARIYPPTTGSVTVRGRVAPLIEMGAGFNPELSGRDNILLNGAMLGFGRREMEAKIAPIFEFTGLAEFADLPLKYYSSGMYTRLAFAIATEVVPEVLLIDESLGVGDASFVAKAKARIRGLMDRSQVVVIVSHDMNSLRELCTRGLWLDHGRLIGDGPMDEIADLYLAAVTQADTAVAPT